MPQSDEIANWDFSPAISLLKTLSFHEQRYGLPAQCHLPERFSKSAQAVVLTDVTVEQQDLGDFSKVWAFLSLPDDGGVKLQQRSTRTESEIPAKEVRWRDEILGADLEDNVDARPVAVIVSERTRKRAQRRLKARERAGNTVFKFTNSAQTATESDTEKDSGQDLERVRASPTRRAVIQDILRQPSQNSRDLPSPPTSPSPPQERSTNTKREPPVVDPFHWVSNNAFERSRSQKILPADNLSSQKRKVRLIARLKDRFGEDAKYLKNEGLIHPNFLPLNTSKLGVHVFIDISNIMIGFHDCLKRSRNIPISARIRRVPMSFHNLSLVLERGRPAAKRVLVGSDKFPIIQQAEGIGYETNILERVHKVKALSPHQLKYRNDEGTSGFSSGSESHSTKRPEKWVEQAVDEVIHLKMLESVIDAEEPSRIVLATGDAQKAEYSGGFLKMVERALLKGWQVEVVSFRSNTSGAYKRKDFRSRWGPMFKCVQLDDYVEDLIDTENV